MPAFGFEHHTMERGAIEHRLVFTREKTQPISPSHRRKFERVVKPKTPNEALVDSPRTEGRRSASRAANEI
jgi:hypothetical protein